MMYGGTGSIDGVDGHTALDHTLRGFAAGADFGTSDKVFIGASIGYSDIDMDFDTTPAGADTSGWNGTLYLSAFDDDSYFEGGIYYGQQDFDSIRSGTIDGESFTTTSSHGGESVMVFAGGGIQVPYDRWDIEPFGMLYYLHVSEDGFTESGGGALNQVVAPRSANLLLGEVGLSFNFLRETERGTIDWSLSVSYNHDFGIDNTALRYAYEGAPTSTFRFSDRELSNSSIALGGALAYTRGRTTLALDYRGQANADAEQHILGTRFSYAFR
jgi:outer membrane autotransporter protein